MCIASEVWLRLTFVRGWSAARHEHEVSGAFHESGACSVGLLEPLEFIGKLVVHHYGRRVPPRVGREAIMKQVEASQILLESGRVSLGEQCRNTARLISKAELKAMS